MAERSEALEPLAVRDVSAAYSVAAGAAAVEEVPPGYKRTEVGVIPEDWSVIELGELARFTTGPFGTALHKADYINGGIPLINPMHIVDSQLSPDSETSVSEDAARRLSPYRMRASDIVIGRRGDMGRCAVVGEDQVGWLCGTGSLIIRCSDRTNAIFVQRILTTDRVIAAIEDSSVGSTMTNLNQGLLSPLKIQLPSMPERHAIATALSDADALIESLDRLIAKKLAIKQAAMQQLLTGQTRLPGFTGEWETKRLGELATCFRGVSYNPDSDLFGYESAVSIRLLRSDSVQSGALRTNSSYFVSQDRVSEKQILRPGDIVICMANGSRALVGKAARFTRGVS